VIEVDYDAEEAAADTATALDPATPLVWPELGSNRAFFRHFGDKAACDAVFAEAARVTRVEFHNNRLVCNFMEARAAIGEWSEAGGRFTLTTGSQGVHSMQKILSSLFGVDKDRLASSPRVGGGFGTKRSSTASTRWCWRRPGVSAAGEMAGDPTEHFLTDAQGRDNVVAAEMAMDGEGRFLALRVDLKANMGAYISQYAPFIPYIGVTMSTGVYDIGALDVSVTGLYTNTCPVDAYRGAGRPEAALLLEKLVDACARDMGLAPDEIRRRNFIGPDQFPYRTPTGRLYDNGEFEGHMNRAMERAEWTRFSERLEEAKARGKIRGIGMATYVEACAFPGSGARPCRIERRRHRDPEDRAQSNGQGHATAYAQFVAEKLNLAMERSGCARAIPTS